MLYTCAHTYSAFIPNTPSVGQGELASCVSGTAFSQIVFLKWWERFLKGVPASLPLPKHRWEIDCFVTPTCHPTLPQEHIPKDLGASSAMRGGSAVLWPWTDPFIQTKPQGCPFLRLLQLLVQMNFRQKLVKGQRNLMGVAAGSASYLNKGMQSGSLHAWKQTHMYIYMYIYKIKRDKKIEYPYGL